MLSTSAKRVQSSLKRKGVLATSGEIKDYFKANVGNIENITKEEENNATQYFLSNSTKLTVVSDDIATEVEETFNGEDVEVNADNAINTASIQDIDSSYLHANEDVLTTENQTAIAPLATTTKSELVSTAAVSLGIELSTTEIDQIADNFDAGSDDLTKTLEQVKGAIIAYVQHKIAINNQKIVNTINEISQVASDGFEENSQTLDRKFGVTLADFDKAIGGDIAAAQKIGELARQGRLSQELAPKLAQAYLEIINGSEAYNKATADILLQAGKSAIAIDKSASQVMLGQQKYVHQRQELAQEFILSKNTENTRHNYQMNYTQIKGYVDAHLVGIDQQTAILEQSNRPEIKQVAANEQYQTKTMNEALNKGETARYDLIPEKNYRTGIMGKIAEIRSALGF